MTLPILFIVSLTAMTYLVFSRILRLAVTPAQNNVILFPCKNPSFLPFQKCGRPIFWANFRICLFSLIFCGLFFSIFLNSGLLRDRFTVPECPELAAVYLLLSYLAASLFLATPIFWTLQAGLQKRISGLSFLSLLLSPESLIQCFFFWSVAFSTTSFFLLILHLAGLSIASNTVLILFLQFTSVVAIFPMLASALVIILWWPVVALTNKAIGFKNFGPLVRLLLTEIGFEEIDSKSQEELIRIIEVAKAVGSVEVADEVSALLVSRADCLNSPK